MAVFLLKKRASCFLCHFFIEITWLFLDNAEQVLSVICLLGRDKYVPFNERETFLFFRGEGGLGFSGGVIVDAFPMTVAGKTRSNKWGLNGCNGRF